MNPALRERVRALGRLGGPVVRRDLASLGHAVAASPDMTCAEACEVLTAYARNRVRVAAVAGRCCVVLKDGLSTGAATSMPARGRNGNGNGNGSSDGDPFAIPYDVLAPFLAEYPALAWGDDLLPGLLLSSALAPSSALYYKSVPADVYVAYVRLAATARARRQATRLLGDGELRRRVVDLPAPVLGRLCSALLDITPRRPSDNDNYEEVLHNAAPAIIQRGMDTLNVMTVPDVTAVVQCLSVAAAVPRGPPGSTPSHARSPGGDGVEAAPPTALESYLAAAYRHISRPFYEASLVLAPPSCLSRLARAYTLLLPGAALTADVVAWARAMLDLHYVQRGQHVPAFVDRALARIALPPPPNRIG